MLFHVSVCSPSDSSSNCISSSTERQVFLATWKDIPNDNEAQFQIKDAAHLNSGKKDEWRVYYLKNKPLLRRIQ